MAAGDDGTWSEDSALFRRLNHLDNFNGASEQSHGHQERYYGDGVLVQLFAANACDGGSHGEKENDKDGCRKCCWAISAIHVLMLARVGQGGKVLDLLCDSGTLRVIDHRWKAGMARDLLRRPWTRYEDETLDRMLRQGTSVMLIAARLGRTSDSVKARMKKKKLGLERPPPPSV